MHAGAGRDKGSVRAQFTRSRRQCANAASHRDMLRLSWPKRGILSHWDTGPRHRPGHEQTRSEVAVAVHKHGGGKRADSGHGNPGRLHEAAPGMAWCAVRHGVQSPGSGQRPGHATAAKIRQAPKGPARAFRKQRKEGASCKQNLQQLHQDRRVV